MKSAAGEKIQIQLILQKIQGGNRPSTVTGITVRSALKCEILYDCGISPYRSVNDLTDNCQYWVGEIYYSIKDYGQAIDAFNKVFNYKDNNKSAYAQYKLGLCYLNINNTSKAVDAFKKVISDYNDQGELVKKSEQFISKYSK